jgi:hypothetical protein
VTVIRILVDIKKGPLGASAAAIPLRSAESWDTLGWVIQRLIPAISVRGVDLTVRSITLPDAMRLFVMPSTPH